MKLSWSKTHALAASVALIVVTNAVALIGVAYNRSGEPDSTLALTERELSVVDWNWLDNENSGVDLRIDWAMRPRPIDSTEEVNAPYDWRGDLDWLTNDDLRALGFDVAQPLDTEEGQRYYLRALPRPAFFVLEFDGSAHRTAVANAEMRLKRATERSAANPDDKQLKQIVEADQRQLDRQAYTASRLYIVGAGADRDALRARFPDRSHYAIVTGRVRIGALGPEHRLRLGASVEKIDIAKISVPHEYRDKLTSLARQAHRYDYSETHAPRYSVTVRYGRRLEPWLADLQPLDSAPR